MKNNNMYSHIDALNKTYLDKVREFKNDNIKESQDATQTEMVNHPTHYNNKYECIDVMRDTFGDEAVGDFCILNAFKYLYRFKKKNGIEDINKCIWYLKYYISIIKDAN